MELIKIPKVTKNNFTIKTAFVFQTIAERAEIVAKLYKCKNPVVIIEIFTYLGPILKHYNININSRLKNHEANKQF